MGIITNLKGLGFVPKKALGQNFLLDEGYLDSVVASVGVTKDDTVVEVGTGAGTLTRAIARAAKKVITYEVDKTLAPFLKNQFGEKGYENIEIKFEDALSAVIDIEGSKSNAGVSKDIGTASEGIIKESNFDTAHGGTPYKLVANVPYYITTPLVLKFLRDPNCTELSVLVQKELAMRIVATSGADYGALSITIGAYADARITKQVPRNLFWPVPGVDSAFVHIVKKPKYEIANQDVFDSLVKGLFMARRKTVLNGFSQWCAGYTFKSGMTAAGEKTVDSKSPKEYTKEEIIAKLQTANIDPTKRPEQLSVPQIVDLLNAVVG